MWFQIFFSFVCAFAATALTTIIITNNREFDGKTAPGWWIISIGISQMFLVAILSVWWKEWFAVNQWPIYISVGIACIAAIIWAFVKISIRRRW